MCIKPLRVVIELISNNLLFCALTLSLLLLASLTPAASAPLPGQPVTNSLTVNTDYKSYNVPVPAGRWTVAAVVKESGEDYHGDSFSLGSTDGVFVNISLIQQNQGTLTGLIIIRAQSKTWINTIDPTLCADSKSALYANKYGASRLVKKCLEVKSLDQASSGAYTDLIEKTRVWLSTSNIALPTNLVGFQYAEYDQTNRYLDFSYYLNPSAHGLSEQSNVSGVSPWTKSAVNADASKLEFITTLTAYAQRYAIPLHEAFEGRGAPSALTLQPFALSTGNGSAGAIGTKNAPDSSSSPSERLEELKRLCKSIGFKEGTSAMRGCVKELISR